MFAMKNALWLALCVAASAVGCSSGMKYKVDDSALDNVSAGEKKDVFAAKNEIEVANSELRIGRALQQFPAKQQEALTQSRRVQPVLHTGVVSGNDVPTTLKDLNENVPGVIPLTSMRLLPASTRENVPALLL